MDLFVVLAAFLTEFLLALAVLLKLRQPGVLVRSQILFVLFTASGLALLACPAVMLIFSEFVRNTGLPHAGAGRGRHDADHSGSFFRLLQPLFC